MISIILNFFHHYKLNADFYVIIAFIASLIIIIFLALTIKLIVNKYITSAITKAARFLKSTFEDSLNKYGFFKSVTRISPAVTLYLLLPTIYIPEIYKSYLYINKILSFIDKILIIYIVFIVVLAIFSFLDAINHYYNSKKKDHYPAIKGYMQLVKILMVITTVIISISILLNKSPVIFLTSLGAASAILILVFKDTILGFIAGIQVSAYDSVRVGDWITIPSLDVDGDVADISINVVKIQNFDKTITTFPSSFLITHAVKNWRGMQNAGGRRIMRSIHIDINTIKSCSDELLNKLSQSYLLGDYIRTKKIEIDEYSVNNNIDNSSTLNGRSLTNIGLFRKYIENYLKQRSDIKKELTFLIRQKPPTEIGLPIEIYVFASTTDWIKYEEIQSDIFDHLLSNISVFELSIFQIANLNVPQIKK